MLQEALRLIATGQVASSEQLAGRLGVELALAKQMLEQLVQLGYLLGRASAAEAAEAVACRARCARCPSAGACFSLPQTWLLTEKGKRAAGAAQSR